MTEQARAYVLANCPGNRQIIKWGEVENPLPEKHYIVFEPPVNSWGVAAKLAELGFKQYYDYLDKSAPIMWGLPFDWKIGETPIGKCSFFGLGDFSPNMSMAIGLFFNSLGRFSSINETVFFQHNHPMNMLSTGRFQQLLPFDKQMEYFQKAKQDPASPNPSEKITIGNDVWIGANAFINVSRCKSIGDGAIIAAGAIVNDDVPPFAVVAGIPGKIKKYRYTPEQIEILLRVKWWDWSNDEIASNADLLLNPKLFFERYQ